MSTSVSTTQLNLRIISIVVFTCICYLSIGLPLAVLPGYIHYQLGYSTFVAGIVISLQYISTLVSRPHAGRYTDIWGPKKVVSLGIVCCLLSGAFTLLAVVLQATPMLAIAALLAGRVFLGVGETLPPPAPPCGGSKPSARSTRHGLSPGTAWRPMWRWRSGRRWELPSITI